MLSVQVNMGGPIGRVHSLAMSEGDDASSFARHTCPAGNLVFFAHAAVTDARLTAHILFTIVYAT